MLLRPYLMIFISKMAVKNCFIRGSVVRYVQLPASAMDTQLLEDATRRGLYCYVYALLHDLTTSPIITRPYPQKLSSVTSRIGQEDVKNHI